MKKSITIFYDYFTPAFKAGGPIRSLANLVALLEEDYAFSVVTGARDKGEQAILEGIKPNEWMNAGQHSRVFYWSGGLITLFRIFRQCKGQTIYINGIYSLYFNILPLFFFNQNIIVAPRGMLHSGALSQKPLKKKWYLFLFKRLGWHKKVRFHATDEEESRFIVDCFGPQTRVFVAPNVPRKIGGLPLRSKEPGQLTLLSIALVSPMKNFDLVLRALLEVKGAVTYHIYGPVIDPDYWKECTAIIEKLPPAVQVYYHGELQPSKVPEALSDTHVFILPSKSENFGHAIFESLSAGKPVVTSYNTPWKDLCRLKAGWNVATEVQAVSALLNRLVEMGPEEYAAYCAGAGRVAELYLEQADFSLLYRRLFEGGS